MFAYLVQMGTGKQLTMFIKKPFVDYSQPETHTSFNEQTLKPLNYMQIHFHA